MAEKKRYQETSKTDGKSSVQIWKGRVARAAKKKGVPVQFTNKKGKKK